MLARAAGFRRRLPPRSLLLPPPLRDVGGYHKQQRRGLVQVTPKLGQRLQIDAVRKFCACFLKEISVGLAWNNVPMSTYTFDASIFHLSRPHQTNIDPRTRSQRRQAKPSRLRCVRRGPVAIDRSTVLVLRAYPLFNEASMTPSHAHTANSLSQQSPSKTSKVSLQSSWYVYRVARCFEQRYVVSWNRPSNETLITCTPATRQHKELRTRIGHQILRLQHLLPPSRGVEQLIALHIDCYEKLWELDEAVTDMNSREPRPMVLESFTNLMSEIEGRMSTVVVRAWLPVALEPMPGNESGA